VMKRLPGYVLIAMFLVYVGRMVCCHAVSFDSAQLSPDLHRAFDDAIPKLMDKRGVPGVAIAVVRGGEVAWGKGYGWADKDRRLPVTEHTVFQAASISKSVSAWVVMKLVENGKLALDTPASRYLTRWQLPASPFDNDGVTLRRILSHTAGLSIAGYLGFPPGTPLQTLEASLTSAADAGQQPLAVVFPPGQGWHYSGGGYTLMQLIVEQATAQSFADFAQSAVLTPLKLNESRFHTLPQGQGETAKAYDRAGNAVPAYRFTAQAAAGLWSTAADLARFVGALMAGAQGDPPGRSVLEPATVGQILSPQPHSSNDLLFEGSEWGLGYGVKRLPSTGEILVYHPGDNIPAWHGMIAALPARRVGLVVLTNGEAGRELRLNAFCLWFRLQGAGALHECNERDSSSDR
jgi:CubicO group peptidase (beta-lactamase class C family)